MFPSPISYDCIKAFVFRGVIFSLMLLFYLLFFSSDYWTEVFLFLGIIFSYMYLKVFYVLILVTFVLGGSSFMK